MSNSPIPASSPYKPNPTHPIVLDDGIRSFGINLVDGSRGIQELAQTASTLRFTGGGGKFGDYEPSLSHLEQRDWSGGRGGAYFADDDSKFFDSHNAWTLSPGVIMPGPAPQWARNGLRNQDVLWLDEYDGTVAGARRFYWLSLLGNQRYRASKFLASANYNADHAYVYLRRIGRPGTFTLELRDTSSNLPNSVLKSATVTVTQIDDTEGVWYKFDWTGTQALTSGTAYWIVVYGASTDNANNHWEIGASVEINRFSGVNGYAEDDNGSGWTGSSNAKTPYYRVCDADTAREFKFFTLDGAFYAVDIRADGSNSHLYQNGTRGKVTSATSSSFTDTNVTDDVHAYASVYIVRGTGVGQLRQINASGKPSTGLNITGTWDTTPDTTSEYIIVGTRYWREITGHGLGVVKDVEVLNNIAYFAQGSGTNMRRIRWNPAAATPTHEFAADATNKADLLGKGYYNSKPVMWRAQTTNDVSRADAQTWGTDLTFGADIPVGDDTWPITNLVAYDSRLAVLKADSVWLVDADVPQQLPVDIDKMPSIYNGSAAISKDLFLYFSFQYSIEKYLEGTLADIGPWRGLGLPANRRGHVRAIEGGVGLIFAAIDGGPNSLYNGDEVKFSSVMATDGIGWHEVWRAPISGQRIRNIGWASGPGPNFLWVECNGDLVGLRFPWQTLNPMHDPFFLFQPECSLISSAYDMGSASLHKYFKEINIATRNLFEEDEVNTPRGNVSVDYRWDNDIMDIVTYLSGEVRWTNASQIIKSPYDKVTIDLSNARSIQFRYRLSNVLGYNVYNTIGMIIGTVLEGYARTPLKYQYILRVERSDWIKDDTGAPQGEADDFVNWLKACAVSTRKITVRSIWKQLDGKIVVIEPPTIMRDGNPAGMTAETGALGWTGHLDVILREV